MTGQITQPDARAWLAARAASYFRDAARFRGAATDGPPILGRDYDAHWAAIYSAIARELAALATEIPRNGLICSCCMNNECECKGASLAPDGIRGMS